MHEELDISDAAAVASVIGTYAPDVVINAAAYTEVDRAESQPQLAMRINAEGPRHLATAALMLPRCRLLHISTDYVFDGLADRPYRPTDPTAPLGVYGRSKLAGERAVLEVLNGRAAVVRTAWVYAPSGRNFLLTMLRLMRERAQVRVVADQRGAPTSAGSVAETLWRVAGSGELHGILHWSDRGEASWYDFACAIAEEALRLGLLSRPVEVLPIKTDEYPTAAARPRYSVLDSTYTAQVLSINPKPWRERLRETMLEIARQ